MTNLFPKIFIFSLFFLLVPVFLRAGTGFNVNFGSRVYNDSEIPVILPRATWENSPDLVKLLDWHPEESLLEEEEVSPPDYFSIDRIIVHDMGCNVRHPGCNDKKLSPLTIIQNIYRYHAVTRGWGDIGYHFIIDYWGNIYEGRYGGNGVRGAHTYYDRKCDNFNVGSVGILLMGNYKKTELSKAIYESLIKLVAWLASTNGLDPTALNHTSEIWHSPKGDSGCDLSQGGLTSVYTGPVVVGHGDIEEGNSDPGLVNLKRVRQEAGKLYLKYKNYIYTTKGDSKIHIIKDGVKKEISIPKEPSSLIVLNKNQLDIFPSLTIKAYPDGALVKSFTRDRVYLTEKNKRRPIFSEKLFKLKKFKWSDIKLLSDRDLAIYSLGAPITYPNGFLVSGTGPEIYLIKNNKRRHISSATLFNQAGFKWEDIIRISQLELLAHPLGEKFLFVDGTLIKGLSPTVYLAEGGFKKIIFSTHLFQKRGFRWQDIVTLADEELKEYPNGEPVLYLDNTLIKEDGLHQIYLVKNQKKHWIKTLKTFLDLGYKWGDVIGLSSEEMSHYVVGSVIEVAGDLFELEATGIVKMPEVTKEPVGDFLDIQATLSQFEGLGEEPNIRIGIYEVPLGKSVKIRADSPYEIYKNNILLASKKANEIIVIPYSKIDFYKFLPSFAKATEGRPASESVIFEIISYEDRPKWNPKLNDNRFRGIIEIKYSLKSKKLWVINELSLENYLKGVAEALNIDPIEYLKAFVIVARSYAMYHIQNGGKRPGEIFHLKNWAFDQLYKGYGFEERAPNITKVTEKTKGTVVIYNNKPIRGVYSSDSGGTTKSACEVFRGIFCDNEDYAYLEGGVRDPDGTIHTQTAITASHGVGMSSAGARKLAELGKSFEEILEYYYSGIEVEKVY